MLSFDLAVSGLVTQATTEVLLGQVENVLGLPQTQKSLTHKFFTLYDNVTTGRIMRTWFSRYLSRTKHAPALKPELLRDEFNSVPFTKAPLQPNHSHPIAAADRSGANSFIERFAASTGLNPYFVQRSRYDEKQGRDGSRDYFWVKDIPARATSFDPPVNPLFCLVDVDQYIDMPAFLGSHNAPTIIYTFQPTSVSRVEKNYNYTFNVNDEVSYTVTGSGKFQHPVWNYSVDHMRVIRSVFGVPVKVSTYYIDRRATSPDHEIILATPIGHWYGAAALFSSIFLSGLSLKRLRVNVSNGFTRLITKSTEGVMVSTGRPDQYLSTTVSCTVDEAIAAIASTSKYDLTLPQVQALVTGTKENSLRLLEYHRSRVDSKPDQVCPVSDAVRSYQFRPADICHKDKPSMHPFMQPMVHASFAPNRNKPNEEECIKARVTDVQPDQLPCGTFLLKCMQEFARRLVPNVGELHPTDYDEVFDRQNRPTQVRNLLSNLVNHPARLVSMFIKAESYADTKAPRPISIINPVDKREYSRFMYALEGVLKRQPWYAFGLTPRDISARVAAVLSKAQFATPTDFSKFDGHGSNLMRQLERMILFRAFKPEYHSQLFDLHKAQFGMKAYGMFGTWYYTNFSRASGSPETSLFNTVFNAFIAFLAARLDMRSEKDAWEGLGIYGGDDGLTADVGVKPYIRAAKLVGQELTIDVVRRGKFGIKFLARVYSSDVWFGDENNCCDLPRQLSKLHTTVNLPSNVTPLEKLSEKVRAYALTDPHTPIIGEFCAAFLSHSGLLSPNEKTAPMRSWLSRFDMDKQYKNQKAEWMTEYAQGAMPDFDHKRFKKWLLSCTTAGAFLSPPMFMEPPEPNPKVPVVVDGEVLPRNTIVKYASELDLPVPIKEEAPRSTAPHPAFVRMLKDKFGDNARVGAVPKVILPAPKPSPPPEKKDEKQGLTRFEAIEQANKLDFKISVDTVNDKVVVDDQGYTIVTQGKGLTSTKWIPHLDEKHFVPMLQIHEDLLNKYQGNVAVFPKPSFRPPSAVGGKIAKKDRLNPDLQFASRSQNGIPQTSTKSTTTPKGRWKIRS